MGWSEGKGLRCGSVEETVVSVWFCYIVKGLFIYCEIHLPMKMAVVCFSRQSL